MFEANAYCSDLTGTKPNALVDFGEEGTSVIRSEKIVEGSKENGKCKVLWSDDKEYGADILFKGAVNLVS